MVCLLVLEQERNVMFINQTLKMLLPLALGLLLQCNSGCAPFDRPEFAMVMDKVSGLESSINSLSSVAKGAGDAANKILEQEGLLDRWLARTRATGINPRVVIAEVDEKRYEVGLGGFEGQIIGEMEGVGHQIPQDVMDFYVERMRDPRSTSDEIDKIIDIIRSDLARTQPRNPPATANRPAIAPNE